MPAQSTTYKHRLSQGGHRSASNLILVVGQILSLKKDIEAVGQWMRHGRTQYEVPSEWQ